MPIAKPTYLNYLAVYGTLRKGGKNDYLEELGCHFVNSITLAARLYNLGSFPGIVLTQPLDSVDTANQYVRCDLFELPKNLEEKIELITSLDRVENFLYNREVYSGLHITNTFPEFYIYTARDWVIDGATQIPGNPADWLEWIGEKNKSNG